MTCCKNTKINRVISLFVSVCFLFCVLVSPATVPKAHAEVITLASAAVVIASILVATGVYVVGGLITDKVKALINDIKLDIAMNDISVTDEGGVGYVQKSVVDAVVNSANKFQLYDPSNTKYNTQTFKAGNLGVCEIFENYPTDSFDASCAPFYKYDRIFSDNSHLKFIGYPVVGNRVYFGPVGIPFSDSHGKDYPGSVSFSTNVLTHGNSYQFNKFYLERNYGHLQACMVSRFSAGYSHDYLLSSEGEYILFDPSSTDISYAGICAQGVVPKFNALGAVEDYPLDWSVPRTVAGNPSVPLSVPETVDGVKDWTQDQAQSGTAEKADSKPEVKPEDANKDFERNKSKFMLPAIVKERFPFCIPFDIYNGILLLSAPAVAPVLTIPFKFDYQEIHFGQDLVFDFNNNDFKLPFAVLRWGEMLCFVIALAAATKKIVWG